MNWKTGYAATGKDENVREQLIGAILTAYHKIKPELMPELPDRMEVLMLVRFELGHLRELEQERDGEQEKAG